MSDQKKILIVEDDADLNEMLTGYFRTQGYEILTALAGDEAVEIATNQHPDLILLDIRLPKKDGFTVCRELRAQRRTQNIPIIFLTEKQEKTDRLQGLELGAVDYITKPFDIHELRLRVRNVLRRASFESMLNPVTNLPEGMVVKEQLEETLQNHSSWGLVLAGVHGLADFREQYGFVAADDVARAVSLMLSRVVEEGHGEDFIGHVDAADFLIITSAEKAQKLAKRCQKRLEPSVPYFYPAVDRDSIFHKSEEERLAVRVVDISSSNGRLRSIDDLRSVLVH